MCYTERVCVNIAVYKEYFIRWDFRVNVSADSKGFYIETKEVQVGTLVPFAVVETDGKQIRISGEMQRIGETRRRFSFGMADCVLYRMESCGVILDTELCQGTDFVLFTQKIWNRTGGQLFFRESGLESASDLKVKKGSPRDWYLGTIHGEETRCADLEIVLPSKNEVTIETWKSFGLELVEELPQDEQHTDGRWRLFEESLTLYTDGGNTGLLFMPVNTPEAFVRFDNYVCDGQIHLKMISDMCSVLVEDGQWRSAQSVILYNGPFYECADRVIDNYSRYLGARTHKKVPCGWCSWYSVFEYVKEEDVFEAVDFFWRHRDTLHPDYIQLDDGYQKTMGDWSNNNKFPSGLAACAARIKELGIMAGIWLAPMIMHDKCEEYKRHPEWIALNENGQPASKLGNWGKMSYALDVTHPEVKQFVTDILREKMAEGFQYFKIDFNNIHTCGKTSYDATKTSLQAYRDLYALYRQVLGEECYLLSCSGFTRGTVGYADASRTGTDTPKNWKGNSCCIHAGIRQNPSKSVVNGRLYAADADVSHLFGDGVKLTENQRRIWHSFVGIFGGVTQISELSEDMERNIDQLKILWPASREKAGPVFPCVDSDNSRMGFICYRSYGNFGVYLLWNPGERKNFPSMLSGSLQSLGSRFHVFSFWDKTYEGIKEADFLLPDFGQYDMKLYRLTPVSSEGIPVVIGTTLHLSMGATEIQDVHNSASGTLTILLNDAGADCGSVFIYSKKALKLEAYENCEAAVVQDGDVAEVKISQRKECQRIVLAYEG